MTKNKFETLDNTFAIDDNPSTNFIAWIVSDIAIKDRQGSTTHHFLIAGRMENGTPLPIVTVAATLFDRGDWLHKEWGTMALYWPPMTIRQLTQAIKFNKQTSIQHATYYNFVGFVVDSKGLPSYVTTAGCITPHGFDQSIKTDNKTVPLVYFSLNKPQIKQTPYFEALDSLLKVCPENPTVPFLLTAFVARSLLGIFEKMGFVMFIVGHTGSKKTSLAQVFQSFFGRGFSSNNCVPVEFHKTTLAGLTSLTSLVNYGLIVVDEFVTLNDQHSKHDTAKADAILRGNSNNAPTLRSTPTTELNATSSTNCGIVVTGEHTPMDAKESLHQRIHYLSIKDSDVDINALTQVQEYANKGYFEAFTYKFIQYFLKNHEEFKTLVPTKRKEFRTKAHNKMGGNLHARQYENAADLMVGSFFLNKFLIHEKQISPNDFNIHCNYAWKLIKESTLDQPKVVKRHSLEGEFGAFLKDRIETGEFYLSNFATGNPIKKTKSAMHIGFSDKNGKLFLYSGREFLASLSEKVPANLKKMLLVNSTSFWVKLRDSGVIVQHDVSKCTIRKRLPFSGETMTFYYLNLDICS
jgi:hypothetical protein